MSDKTKMTREEMEAVIANLTSENANLVKNQGTNMKTRVLEMIESGINTIEEIAEGLSITSKNVSSNLTAIRADIKEAGKIIVTHRMNGQTKLAVVSLTDLGW